jgi:glycine betaine transporter
MPSGYGIPDGKLVLLILCIIITGTFTLCTYLGLEKGIKRLAVFNTKLFYFLLIFLFLFGPTAYIMRSFTAGMATWLNNFWSWGLDPVDIGGSQLVMSWTLFDWSMWIAYAPLLGIFLAMISYGRTIRQFMIINWIVPSIFGLVWISVWGGTALNWQINGKVDLVKLINDNGFVAGLWGFLQHVPFVGFIIVPLVILALIVSFSTTADSMTITIASICTKNLKHGEEPAKWQKLIWGIFIGTISFLMIAYGGGIQGVDGIKFLAVIGGFIVLFIFILQLASLIKIFFIDKPDNDQY